MDSNAEEEDMLCIIEGNRYAPPPGDRPILIRYVSMDDDCCCIVFCV